MFEQVLETKKIAGKVTGNSIISIGLHSAHEWYMDSAYCKIAENWFEHFYD